MPRESKAARAAREASLNLPGWAWEQGADNLWVLGHREAATGYTLPMLIHAYGSIKSQVPPDNERNNPIRRYVRIHPSRAGLLIRDTKFAMATDPTAMMTGRQTTIQVRLAFDGDQVSLHISGALAAGGQNCFFFIRPRGRAPFSQFIPLPQL